MKTKYTESQLEQISKLQSQYGITRKSAIRRFEKQSKEAARAAKRTAATDVKKLAANDKAEAPAPRTEAGAARSEGIRLFKLAGKPSKQDFIHVFGKPGVAWTWVARAKAVGLNSAEECARKFPSMRSKAPQSCVVATEEPKSTAASNGK